MPRPSESFFGACGEGVRGAVGYPSDVRCPTSSCTRAEALTAGRRGQGLQFHPPAMTIRCRTQEFDLTMNDAQRTDGNSPGMAFERPIAEIEAQIAELESLSLST